MASTHVSHRVLAIYIMLLPSAPVLLVRAQLDPLLMDHFKLNEPFVYRIPPIDSQQAQFRADMGSDDWDGLKGR